MAWKHFLKCKSEEHRHLEEFPYAVSKANGGFVTHEQALHHLADTILPSAIFQKICIRLASKMTGVKTKESKDCKVESPKSLKIILILEILQKNL
jgi:hypothetical protein